MSRMPVIYMTMLISHQIDQERWSFARHNSEPHFLIETKISFGGLKVSAF